MRRLVARACWRVFNPIAVRLAGLAPWWVVLETTGRRTGKARRAPLARGPVEDGVAWLIAVHGRHSGFAHNIEASPAVRFKLKGRWYDGRASIEPLDPAIVRRCSTYARMGPKTFGMDPALVRIELRDRTVTI